MHTRRPFFFALFTTLAWAGAASAQARPVAAGPPSLAAAFEGHRRHPLADDQGRVAVSVRLGPGDDARALGLLEVSPGIGAAWVPEGEVEAFTRRHAARSPWASPPLKPLLDRSGAFTRAVQAHAQGHSGKGVVIGVIDTGIDVTHPDLRELAPDGSGKSQTRIAWMLDLAAKPLGLHADLEARFGCSGEGSAGCAVYAREDLDGSLKESLDDINDAVGHGTHVGSIAAGNGGSTPYVGVAPEATLIAVRVTRSRGGAAITDVDILNAVNFVFDRAEAMGMPAVVNVSLGGDYGPHDGTSTLESGLASFVSGGRPGRAIVVAAGNSAGIVRDSKGEEYGVHTEARVLEGASTRAVLSSPAGATPMAGAAFVWITMRPGDDVSVGVEVNDELVLRPMARGEQGARLAESGRNPYIAVINNAYGGTSPLSPSSNGAVVAIDGDWKASDRFAIVLEGKGYAQLWVQGTGDAEFGSPLAGELFLRPMKQGTVNVPATHPDLLAVGCTLNRLDWVDVKGESIKIASVGSVSNPPLDTICYFSGAGPNALGVPKPEIAAPGGFIAAAMSARARPGSSTSSMFMAPDGRCDDPESCYVVDTRHAVSSGTSMSAPHVAGAVALLFEQQPDLTQREVTTILQAGARRFEGLVPLEPQAGPGALDVNGALLALAEWKGKNARKLTPDLGKSWLQVSSSYARPDGSTPVTLTIELRASDGTPADGLEQGDVQLERDNAVLLAGPIRLAPGLYQAKVAAPPGTGGERMRLGVRVKGQLLGERNLPIGADLWLVRGAPSSEGGCSQGRPPQGNRLPTALVMGLAAALARRHSRKR